MSDWELATSSGEMSPESSISSEWEVATSPAERPSFGKALIQAPQKIAEDVYGAATNFAGNIPQYYQQAKKGLPEALIASRFHPASSLAQITAGGIEGARNFLNIPSDISNYLSERLDLLPENVNQYMQKIRLPDITPTVNSIFGEPQYPGQSFLRGGGRQLFNIGLGLNSMTGINNLRPSQFTRNKVSEIGNEYRAAKELEKQTYAKVFEPYGNNPITINPKKYFSRMGIERNKLLPDARILYDDVLKTPSLNNIHRLQSQIGSDANKVFENYPGKYQTFRDYKNKLMDDTQSYLSKIDRNALDTYNLGRQITRDVVSPFTANVTLEQVAKGVYPKISAKELVSAIQKAKRDIIYEKKGKPVTAIHPEHSLSNHLNDIEKMISSMNRLKYGLGAAGIGVTGAGITNKIFGSATPENPL